MIAARPARPADTFVAAGCIGIVQILEYTGLVNVCDGVVWLAVFLFQRSNQRLFPMDAIFAGRIASDIGIVEVFTAGTFLRKIPHLEERFLFVEDHITKDFAAPTFPGQFGF